MTCFNPKYAYYTYRPVLTKKGRVITKDITFTTKANYNSTINEIGKGKLIIPCGKCLGCRLDKAAEWGTRGLLESQNWKNNCFITLTYNPESLKSPQLEKSDIQKFLKRLRKHYHGIEKREYKGKEDKPIRYFYSGEYGPEKLRPHFHVGIFNWRPKDLKFWRYNQWNDPMYLSDTVAKLWGKGFIVVEDMNYNTAQYIGRYTAKKCLGMDDEKIKSKGLKKEFIETSRRPGLANNIITDKAKFEKMKRNFGFLIKDKTGKVKIKKIGTFLREKWKDIDRLGYFEIADKRREEAEKNFKEKLSKTDLSIHDYLKQQKNTIIQKLKAKKTLKRNKAVGVSGLS